MHNPCYLFLLLIPGFLSAQNLVPNPGFEEYDFLPTVWDHLNNAVPWRNPTTATPDFMHEDCPDGTVYRARVPDNAWGWQYAHSGKGYITLHTWTEETIELEYAQVALTDTLQPGREYTASAWISRGDFSAHSTNCQGFLLTETPFTGQGVLQGKPQVLNLEILRDTQNWVFLSGRFIADKPYTVLTLGNFCGLSAPYQQQDEWGWNKHTASYFWDDISLTPTEKKVDIEVQITGDCLPATVRLNGTQFGPDDEWSWQWGDGLLQSGQQVSRILPQNGEYRVELTMKADGQTFKIERIIQVNLPEAPIARFEIDDEKYRMSKPLHFKNSSQNSTSWNWDFGDGETSDEEHPEHTFEERGEYRITLVAANDVGCTDSFTLELYVACYGKIDRNTFTPNADGFNDVFPFDSIAVCGPPIDIRIFNRWGNLLYESSDPFVPWRAEGIENGTYFYLIRYKGGDESGYIELMR